MDSVTFVSSRLHFVFVFSFLTSHYPSSKPHQPQTYTLGVFMSSLSYYLVQRETSYSAVYFYADMVGMRNKLDLPHAISSSSVHVAHFRQMPGVRSQQCCTQSGIAIANRITVWLKNNLVRIRDHFWVKK